MLVYFDYINAIVFEGAWAMGVYELFASEAEPGQVWFHLAAGE